MFRNSEHFIHGSVNFGSDLEKIQLLEWILVSVTGIDFDSLIFYELSMLSCPSKFVYYIYFYVYSGISLGMMLD